MPDTYDTLIPDEVWEQSGFLFPRPGSRLRTTPIKSLFQKLLNRDEYIKKVVGRLAGTTNWDDIPPSNIQSLFNQLGSLNTQLNALNTSLTQHKTAAVLDHPDSSVTDSKIGNRTINDSLSPTTDTNNLTTLLSNLANRIKSITGSTGWKDNPPDTLINLNNTVARKGVNETITGAWTFNNNVVSSQTITASRFISTVASGTAPLVVTSNTRVDNLNADLLDGYDSVDFPRKAENATITGSWMFNNDLTLNSSGLQFRQSDTLGTGVRLIEFKTNSGVLQWGIGHLGALGGGNSGNDFTIWRYSDTGGYLANALRISRSTGDVTVYGRLIADGGLAVYGTNGVPNWLANTDGFGLGWNMSGGAGEINFVSSANGQSGGFQNIATFKKYNQNWNALQIGSDGVMVGTPSSKRGALGLAAPGNGAWTWIYNQGSDLSIGHGGDPNNLTFIATFLSNGFVGINKPSPDYRFVVEESANPIAVAIRKTNNGGNGGAWDGPALLVEHTYGNHSWGNVAEFRVNDAVAKNPPNITFTAGWASVGWAVGMAGSNDSDLAIVTNRGFRYNQFGTVQLRVKPDGQVITSGTLTPGISSGFAGHINSSGPIKFSNGNTAQEIYVRKVRASTIWSTNDANDPGDGGGFFSGKLFVQNNSGFNGTPAIALAIGDEDTGFHWISDGVLAGYGNNSEAFRFSGAQFDFKVPFTGRYDHQNRFVVQGYTPNITVPANDIRVIASNRVSLPSGKSLYLRRVRWSIFGTLLRPRIASTLSTWTGSDHYGEIEINQQLSSTSLAYVELVIVNNTGSNIDTGYGAGIWAELEIR